MRSVVYGDVLSASCAQDAIMQIYPLGSKVITEQGRRTREVLSVISPEAGYDCTNMELLLRHSSVSLWKSMAERPETHHRSTV